MPISARHKQKFNRRRDEQAPIPARKCTSMQHAGPQKQSAAIAAPCPARRQLQPTVKQRSNDKTASGENQKR
jgi:hypothetical protein